MIPKLLRARDNQLQLLLIMPTESMRYLDESTCREDARKRFELIKHTIVHLLVLPENVDIEKENDQP